jgi:hypothetical protein
MLLASRAQTETRKTPGTALFICQYAVALLEYAWISCQALEPGASPQNSNWGLGHPEATAVVVVVPEARDALTDMHAWLVRLNPKLP